MPRRYGEAGAEVPGELKEDAPGEVNALYAGLKLLGVDTPDRDMAGGREEPHSAGVSESKSSNWRPLLTARAISALAAVAALARRALEERAVIVMG